MKSLSVKLHAYRFIAERSLSLSLSLSFYSHLPDSDADVHARTVFTVILLGP